MSGDDSDSGGDGGGNGDSEAAAGAAGRVYVWGDNSKGQLGVPDVARAMEPMLVGGELAKAQVKQVRIRLFSQGSTDYTGNIQRTRYSCPRKGRDKKEKLHWRGCDASGGGAAVLPVTLRGFIKHNISNSVDFVPSFARRVTIPWLTPLQDTVCPAGLLSESYRNTEQPFLPTQ